MTKRIEQSRHDGPHAPGWTPVVHAVSPSPPALDEPEEPTPTGTPPTLTLVGGTASRNS